MSYLSSEVVGMTTVERQAVTLLEVLEAEGRSLIDGGVILNAAVREEIQSRLAETGMYWTCQVCKESSVVLYDELITIGVPRCSDCDIELDRVTA